MFGSSRNPVTAYAQVGVDSAVQSADPHRLIILLFEGAESAIAIALAAIEQNNLQAKSQAIGKAIDIINDGLNASLNKEAGGDIAAKLSALYDYMCARLLYANLKNDVAALNEVNALLNEIHGAWSEIGHHRQP
jgi:flagellar protein FliS